MNESTASPEVIIERVRREVARRKGMLDAVPVPPPPQKKSMLKKAAAAIERAKTKHFRARSWPRLLRPLRRNQEVINEALITAAQALMQQMEYLSRLVAPLPVEHSRLATKVQQQAEYQTGLGTRFQAIEAAKGAPPAAPENTDAFYVAFEDQFRGSSDLIRERLLEYLPYLQDLAARFTKISALDLGCGRGEWLRMLKENGAEAHGVDLNGCMVENCRRAGLNASSADALEYLKAQEAGSLALVSGFHIVEHLEFTKLLALFSEIHRVLAPGGIAIFETPNPECLRVSSYTFYMDPTHRNPVPMELLSFIATHAGFSATQVERLHPYCEDGKLQAYGDYAGIFTK